MAFKMIPHALKEDGERCASGTGNNVSALFYQVTLQPIKTLSPNLFRMVEYILIITQLQ